MSTEHPPKHKCQPKPVSKAVLKSFFHQQPGSISIMAPNNIIFELFGTILHEPNREAAINYIYSHLVEYLVSIWEEKTMKHLLRRLRREQLIESQESNFKEMPLIPAAEKVEEANEVCKSVAKQLLWRSQTGKQSQISALVFKLAIEEGYRSNRLQSQPYKEVGDCFRNWRQTLLIKLYSFGNGPADEQKLALGSTSQGNLCEWVANFIDGSEKRQKPDIIRKLAGALRDKTNNCIFITHELADALVAINSGVIRCVFLVDRNNKYGPKLSSELTSLITSEKLFFMSSLDCVSFVANPENSGCC